MFTNDAAAFLAKCREIDRNAHATLGTSYAEFSIALGVVPVQHGGLDLYTLHLTARVGTDTAACAGKILMQPVTPNLQPLPGTSPTERLSRACGGRLTADRAVECTLNALIEHTRMVFDRELSERAKEAWGMVLDGVERIFWLWLESPSKEGA